MKKPRFVNGTNRGFVLILRSLLFLRVLGKWTCNGE